MPPEIKVRGVSRSSLGLKSILKIPGLEPGTSRLSMLNDCAYHLRYIPVEPSAHTHSKWGPGPSGSPQLTGKSYRLRFRLQGKKKFSFPGFRMKKYCQICSILNYQKVNIPFHEPWKISNSEHNDICFTNTILIHNK